MNASETVAREQPFLALLDAHPPDTAEAAIQQPIDVAFTQNGLRLDHVRQEQIHTGRKGATWLPCNTANSR